MFSKTGRVSCFQLGKLERVGVFVRIIVYVGRIKKLCKQIRILFRIAMYSGYVARNRVIVGEKSATDDVVANALTNIRVRDGWISFGWSI